MVANSTDILYRINILGIIGPMGSCDVPTQTTMCRQTKRATRQAFAQLDREGHRGPKPSRRSAAAPGLQVIGSQGRGICLAETLGNRTGGSQEPSCAINRSLTSALGGDANMSLAPIGAYLVCAVMGVTAKGGGMYYPVRMGGRRRLWQWASGDSSPLRFLGSGRSISLMPLCIFRQD